MYACSLTAPSKISYSTTLDAVPTAKTKLERTFDPDSVREIKASYVTANFS